MKTTPFFLTSSLLAQNLVNMLLSIRNSFSIFLISLLFVTISFDLQAQTQIVKTYTGRIKVDGNDAGIYIEAGNEDWFFGRSGSDLRFNYNGDKFTFSKYGNIGIGTASPQAKIDIVSGSNGLKLLRFNTDRAWSFVQQGTGSNTALVLQSETDGKNFRIKSSDGKTLADFYTSQYAGANQINFVQDGGSVAIGTAANPGNYKLAVEGKIGAREIDVKTGSWADFVFDQDYALPGLEQVDTYIQAHHHLPDLPSEAEVLENGISLGEMQKLLLQKIEELTLYVIDQQKQIKQLQQ